MANPADEWSSADLKGVATGGLIREEVMAKIWDISAVPLNFTDMVGSDTTGNSYCEWTTDRLSEPNLENAYIDGQDLTENDARGGARVGNHCQISTKRVSVTTRANNSDVIGQSKALAYQLMMRQRELRRDVEAIATYNQGSQSDDGDTTPGKAGSMQAWITTNYFAGAGGAAGGFSNGAVSAATLGTPRALSEAMVRDACQAVWEAGGDPSVMMSNSATIRAFSEYMFTDASRIGNQQTETQRSGDTNTAIGYVNVFQTDFGVSLRMVANRLQPYADGDAETNSSVYIFDPAHWRMTYLHGYRTEPQAKTGLADKRQMAVDWTLKCLVEESAAVIADVDATAPVTLGETVLPSAKKAEPEQAPAAKKTAAK